MIRVFSPDWMVSSKGPPLQGIEGYGPFSILDLVFPSCPLSQALTGLLLSFSHILTGLPCCRTMPSERIWGRESSPAGAGKEKRQGQRGRIIGQFYPGVRAGKVGSAFLVPQGFPMVAEEIDAFGLGFRNAIDQDRPCFFISMVCSSESFRSNTGLPSGARSKIHQIRPLSSFEPFGKVTVTSMVFPFTTLNLGWGEQVTFDAVGKEMLEHERGFVVLVPFGFGALSAVPRVGPEVNRMRGGAFSCRRRRRPCHECPGERACRRPAFSTHPDYGKENAIGNFAGEFLEILPGSAGIENPPVVVVRNARR